MEDQIVGIAKYPSPQRGILQKNVETIFILHIPLHYFWSCIFCDYSAVGLGNGVYPAFPGVIACDPLPLLFCHPSLYPYCMAFLAFHLL